MKYEKHEAYQSSMVNKLSAQEEIIRQCYQTCFQLGGNASRDLGLIELPIHLKRLQFQILQNSKTNIIIKNISANGKMIRVVHRSVANLDT